MITEQKVRDYMRYLIESGRMTIDQCTPEEKGKLYVLFCGLDGVDSYLDFSGHIRRILHTKLREGEAADDVHLMRQLQFVVLDQLDEALRLETYLHDIWYEERAEYELSLRPDWQQYAKRVGRYVGGKLEI